MKTISFGIPCYNSASYMDKCIESLLACGEDVEIIIVDDGSTKDDTAEKADEWQARYPAIVKAVHQENGGHGAAVCTGLAHATGLYYKVVDSDDWLDADAMKPIMEYLRLQIDAPEATDMVIANYVYEKVYEGTQQVMGYKNIFPEGRVFGWDDIGTFKLGQYLLMHSVIYRTQMLRDMHLTLPHHCFYVDNIYVYTPLPHVKTMHYFDEDMYRYFIGREGQSVNEKTMMNRMDQQIRVIKTMVDDVDVMAITDKKLRSYMIRDLAMMMTICSVFLRMRNQPGDKESLKGIWEYLKKKRPTLYPRIRWEILNLGTNLPTELGRRFSVFGYHVAQNMFSFN